MIYIKANIPKEMNDVDEKLKIIYQKY